MDAFNGSTDCETSGLTSDPRLLEIQARLATQTPGQRRKLADWLENEEMVDLADSLREAIIESGKTYYSLASESGVGQEVISRFARGERDLRLETASKLAAVLELDLVTRTRQRKRKWQ